MQKLETIEIKNFKSIRVAKIEDCRRVNIFIGYPNVGKSNILEAIGLLAFLPEERNEVYLKDLVRFEDFTNLFNFSNIATPAVIKFNDEFSLKLQYINESYLNMKLDDSITEKSSYHPGMLGIRVERENVFNNIKSNSGEPGGILKDDFSGRFEKLQDLKVKPYKYSEDKVFDESYSAIQLKVPFGRNLFEVVANNESIKKTFSDLLKPYGFVLFIDRIDKKIIITRPVENGILEGVPLSLIADTLLRLFFYNASIISNKDSVLIFEEPEAHMFPPYISKFTNDIVFDKNNNQYFIATHSPYVMNDFIDNLEHDELRIYIVSLEGTDKTKITKMSETEVHKAYQFGYDFFMNLENFILQDQHD